MRGARHTYYVGDARIDIRHVGGGYYEGQVEVGGLGGTAWKFGGGRPGSDVLVQLPAYARRRGDDPESARVIEQMAAAVLEWATSQEANEHWREVVRATEGAWDDEAGAYVVTDRPLSRMNPRGLTAKGERMYEHVKKSYRGDPRAKEIAARTVYARASEGAPGLRRKKRNGSDDPTLDELIEALELYNDNTDGDLGGETVYFFVWPDEWALLTFTSTAKAKAHQRQYGGKFAEIFVPGHNKRFNSFKSAVEAFREVGLRVSQPNPRRTARGSITIPVSATERSLLRRVLQDVGPGEAELHGVELTIRDEDAAADLVRWLRGPSIREGVEPRRAGESLAAKIEDEAGLWENPGLRATLDQAAASEARGHRTRAPEVEKFRREYPKTWARMVARRRA